MKKLLFAMFFLSFTLSIFSDIKYALPDTKSGDTIIKHTYYTIDYNKEYMNPNWCAEELTYSMTQGTATRPSKFKKDPLLPESFDHSEYTNSTYDRGHQVPAADMKFSQEAMNETFYTTNICPQYPQLNQQDWEHLEELVRVWADDYKDISLYIVTGPIYVGTNHTKLKPKYNVTIPEKYFKAIMIYYPESPESSQAIGFIMENVKPETGKTTEDYAVPVSQIEKETGYTMFAAVPEPYRTNMVKTMDKAKWNWSKTAKADDIAEQAN